MKLGYSNNDISNNKKITGKGYFAFGFIFLIWWVVFFIGIYVTDKGDWSKWVLAFTIASVVSFCFSLIWLCYRWGTKNQNQHVWKKVFGNFFRRKSIAVINKNEKISQENNIERQHNSLIMFYFTLTFFLLLVIISIILSFSL